MSPEPKSSRRGRNIIFVLIVGAAYLSTAVILGYSMSRPYLTRISLLIIPATAYLLIGIYGFAKCRQDGSLKKTLLYFLVQLALAALLIYISQSFLIALIMLPLASQCVELLPTRWLIAICSVIMITVVCPLWLMNGLGAAALIGSFYLTLLAVVVASTYIAVKEHKARTEIERLATELSDANVKLREYTAKIEELATIKERNRLAREIHDSLGHYLTIINMQLEAAQAVMGTDDSQARDVLKKAQALAQDGLVDVRQSVAALRTNTTKERPLLQALSALIDEIRATGVETSLSIEGTPRPLQSHISLAFYRAAQEALTNIHKHAKAKSANITLDYSAKSAVRLIVKDNGIGSTEHSSGFGLTGIQERAQLLGGNVTIQTAPDQGFTLTIELSD